MRRGEAEVEDADAGWHWLGSGLRLLQSALADAAAAMEKDKTQMAEIGRPKAALEKESTERAAPISTWPGARAGATAASGLHEAQADV